MLRGCSAERTEKQTAEEKKMKKTAVFILCAALFVSALTACGREEDGLVTDSPNPTHTVEEDIIDPLESMLPSELPSTVPSPSASPKA